MNTKQVGEMSEAFVAAHLLRLGYSVSRPLGDNQRYDLLLDTGTNLFRIQVKTAAVKSSGAIRFPMASSYHHRGGTRVTYLGSVDYILAYAPYYDKVYVERVTETSPESNRTIGYRNLTKYELATAHFE